MHKNAKFVVKRYCFFVNFMLQYMQIVSDEVFGTAFSQNRLTEELWRTLKWVPKVQG